jgi:nucleoside 2-deoxyribosyltransferase
MKIYLIGSLRNPEVLTIGNLLRSKGFNVFEDWMAAGKFADDAWRDYEKQRGHSYLEALNGLAAEHVFEYDKKHLDDSDAAVLVMPAGKSAHLEMGYMLGKNKPAFILFDKEPERYDVMYKFATGVFVDIKSLIKTLKQYSKRFAWRKGSK